MVRILGPGIERSFSPHSPPRVAVDIDKHPQEQQQDGKGNGAGQDQAAGARPGGARLCFAGMVSVAHGQGKCEARPFYSGCVVCAAWIHATRRRVIGARVAFLPC